MRAHYYRHQKIERLSKNVPEDEKEVWTDPQKGKELDVDNQEELALMIWDILKTAIEDHYTITDVNICIKKKNKRREKRQLISVYNYD